MTRQPFESSAQNAEDVVLWRALAGAVGNGVGRYVEIGANDPVVDSISWAFYQRGWQGITAEPVASLAAAHRELRPRDVQVEAVVGALDAAEVVLHEIAHSGLSTIQNDIAGQHAAAGWTVEDRTVPVRRLDDVLTDAGWDDGRDIHFLTVDTEGSELAVLQSLDLRRFRPWVLVIEATAPTSAEQTHDAWEHLVVDAGYELCLFDGLSRFYAAAEHADRLAPLLYPACSLDEFSSLAMRVVRAETDQLHEDLTAARTGAAREIARLEAKVADVTAEAVRWRIHALTRWSHAVGGAAAYSANSEVMHVRSEMAAMRNTVSWRVTRPLRSVRSRAGALRARP